MARYHTDMITATVLLQWQSDSLSLSPMKAQNQLLLKSLLHNDIKPPLLHRLTAAATKWSILTIASRNRYQSGQVTEET